MLKNLTSYKTRRLLHLKRACSCLWQRGILHLVRSCLDFMKEYYIFGAWASCICTDRTDRTNRNALSPDIIMRCTFRMCTDRTDRTNRNALCPDLIMRCTLRMCSAYGPWVIVTVCAERTVRQPLLTVCNSAAVLDMTAKEIRGAESVTGLTVV